MGVLTGLLGTVTYLKLKKGNLIENAEKLSDSVADNLRELEARLERGVHLDLVERSA